MKCENECCKSIVEQLLSDLGAYASEYAANVDAELIWAFREEYLGAKFPLWISRFKNEYEA